MKNKAIQKSFTGSLINEMGVKAVPLADGGRKSGFVGTTLGAVTMLAPALQDGTGCLVFDKKCRENMALQAEAQGKVAEAELIRAETEAAAKKEQTKLITTVSIIAAVVVMAVVAVMVFKK